MIKTVWNREYYMMNAQISDIYAKLQLLQLQFAYPG